MFALFQMMTNIGITSREGSAISLSGDVGFTVVFRLLASLNLGLIPLLFLVTQGLAEQRAMVDHERVETIDNGGSYDNL